MASHGSLFGFNFLVLLGVLLICFSPPVHAFGAGNIASISAVEGKNWRHGDIEDMLKTIVCLKGHKWTTTMINRVYFGNWLRDYSQAMDVGTLKSLPADTIRILVWILSFMSFGLATDEFEVTSDRLGVYRPEEHIDNPKDYADNQDARQYDPRLRPPIRQVELDIDPETGMKNYIANERGDWDTSSAFIKKSLSRSIHYGRKYTTGGNESDLCEALRYLGQGLHTLEDFGAHTNYCELALREMGFHNVFPHTGSATQMDIRGHYVFPMVTGTFGMVDFVHSMMGEATDHFTQSEVNEMDLALGNAQGNSSSNSLTALTGLLGKLPGTRDLVTEAEGLKQVSDAREFENRSGAHSGYASGASRGFQGSNQGWSGSRDGSEYMRASNQPSGQSSGLAAFDPQETIDKIYPILRFRDNVVRKITSIIEKIPGLESMMEKVSDTLTTFIMSLLAPFIRPIIQTASSSLQTGSSGVIDASGKHQYEPWTDPTCTDPTHSLLSKDHFVNILNEPAGHVASAILRYVAPRVLYAWEHPDVPEHEVLHDCVTVFHHPALRNMHNEAHRTMFEAVESWVNARPDRGARLNDILSADGIKAGKNNKGGQPHSHGGGCGGSRPPGQNFTAFGGAGYSSRPPSAGAGGGSSGSPIPWDKLSQLPIPGISNIQKIANAIPGGLTREGESESDYRRENHSPRPHHQSPYHSSPSPAGSGSASDYYSQPSGEYRHHSPQPQYQQGGYQQQPYGEYQQSHGGYQQSHGGYQQQPHGYPQSQNYQHGYQQPYFHPQGYPQPGYPQPGYQQQPPGHHGYPQYPPSSGPGYGGYGQGWYGY